MLYKQWMGGTGQGASRSAAVHRGTAHRGHDHPKGVDGHAGSAKEHSRAAEHRHPKRGRKHSKHKHHHRHHRGRHPHTLAARAVALPTAPATPPAPSSAPAASLGGPLSTAGAQRLLWRAGFGPRPGEAQALAGQPLQQVVFGLTRPAGAAALSGPEPIERTRRSARPRHDVWGDDHCWWLDRMVRSDQQLVERMTFIWHDWFANSNEKVEQPAA